MPSAFKAVNETTAQSVGPNPVQIEYPDEIFDLNNEYNPSTSTFTPKQDGVYSIIASIGFLPNNSKKYSVRIFIVVNGDPVAADNDFMHLPIVNLVNVSTILKLSEGDEVQVSAQATTNGNTVPEPLENTVHFTHFEAARFPSPA